MNKKKILITSIVLSGILTFVSFFVGGVKYPDPLTGIMPIWVQLMRNFGFFLVLITPAYALYHKIDMGRRGGKTDAQKERAFMYSAAGELLIKVLFIGYAVFLVWGFLSLPKL